MRRDDDLGLIGSRANRGITGRRVGEQLALAPRRSDREYADFMITAASDPAVLQSTGLRVGDVLIDVDGQPLTQARIQTLGDELSVFDRVEISFERDGQIRNRTLDLER